MEHVEEQTAPGAAPAGTKSALAFFGVLLALFPAALLAQYASPVAGLAATQLFAFLVPAVVATAGSNLRLAPYLRLRPPRPALVVLGTLAGGAGFVVAAALASLAQRLAPERWVEAYDLSRLFEGPAWERAALTVVAAGLAPLCEEITFRGYLQTTLAVRRGPAVAIGGGALLFAALHLDPVRFPALVALGAVFGWMTWRSGSIWPAVAAHAAHNGVGAALLLTAPPAADGPPPAAALVMALALGGSGLALVLSLFAGAAGPPEPPAAAVVLRDPSSPSVAFDVGRVPPRIRLAAVAGTATLLALAVAGLLRGAGRSP